MNNNKIDLLNFSINTSIEKLNLNDNRILISTINPHSYCVTKKDPIFRDALRNSDILIPDGIGIVIAARFLAKAKIQRISGADLHEYILKTANKENCKVFYLGSKPHTLQKIKERLKIEYPNILFECYSPPYKQSFSPAENQLIINAINAFQPNVLFVGMTAPKQEKWSFINKEQLETNIIASIGAVFDFYAGTIKRPGLFWQKSGMEWLLRLLREPKRLWRRNFVSTPCFLWDVFKSKIG